MVDFRQWYFHMQNTRAGEAEADARYDKKQSKNPTLTPAQRSIYTHEESIDEYWANRRREAARRNKPL